MAYINVELHAACTICPIVHVTANWMHKWSVAARNSLHLMQNSFPFCPVSNFCFFSVPSRVATMSHRVCRTHATHDTIVMSHDDIFELNDDSDNGNSRILRSNNSWAHTHTTYYVVIRSFLAQHGHGSVQAVVFYDCNSHEFEYPVRVNYDLHNTIMEPLN